jgi:hypothetical protein
MKQENDLMELANNSGVRVTQFFVSITFFPDVIKSGKSNELFSDIVSKIVDTLNDDDSLVQWHIQSIRFSEVEK